MNKEKLVIGILGGMGPAATVDIFAKIVAATPASRDHDHIRIVIDNNPLIPDRIPALRGRGLDPVPDMLRASVGLHEMGEDFIIIPCNTAHIFLERFQHKLNIPIMSITEETAAYLTEECPSTKKVGLLATQETISWGIYHEVLETKGFEVVVPEPDFQEKVTDSILGPSGIKAGNVGEYPRGQLIAAAEHLIRAGAELILMACTEIPLVLRQEHVAVPLYDPSMILAQAAVRMALEGKKKISNATLRVI